MLRIMYILGEIKDNQVFERRKDEKEYFFDAWGDALADDESICV